MCIYIYICTHIIIILIIIIIIIIIKFGLVMNIQRQNHSFVDTQSFFKMPSRHSVGGSPVANKSFVCLVVVGPATQTRLTGDAGKKWCDPNLLGPVEGLIVRKTKTTKNIPSRELTYPTLGKGKSSAKVPFWGGYVSSLEGSCHISVEFFDKLLMVC